VTDPSGLQRLIERAYQLRIAAGIGERAARWGAVVDASRAEPYIRPRPQLVEAPPEEPPVGEGQA
jgi:hypothetical protein